MTYRTKNDFSFEWDDSKHPYGEIFGLEQVIPVGSRKFIAFNYSTEYFRRKLADANGLYFIRGGNIPSDMASAVTIESPAANPVSAPTSITCSTLSGSATPIAPVPSSGLLTVVNLSPNRLLEVPEICDQPWPPDKEIIYEKAKDQKPNSLYFLAYQPSCSYHTLATGFAHEDPYTCLKKRAEGGGVAQVNINGRSFCCDDFCKCFFDSVYGSTISAVAYILEDIPGSDPLQQRFVRISTDTSYGFCCASVRNFIGTKFLSTATNGNDPAFLEECGSNNDPCKFGFYVDLNSTPAVQAACPIKEVDGKTYFPMNAVLTYTYQAGGNTNCGCNQGRKGKVTLSGTKQCVWCSYASPYSDGTPGYDGNLITKECSEDMSSQATLCACIFNAKVKIGEIDIYLTTMSFPTFKYPDGQALEITDDGTIVSKGCGDEIIFSCNDVN